jgi:hypothetical protein
VPRFDVVAKLLSTKYPYKARPKAAVVPLYFYKGPAASGLTFTQVGQSFTRGHDDFNLFFMPIKEPLDANSRKTMRKTRNNLYTERGRPVKIHWFLIRVLELFLGNLDDFKKYS